MRRKTQNTQVVQLSEMFGRLVKARERSTLQNNSQPMMLADKKLEGVKRACYLSTANSPL